jgi:hypothetical protein
MMPTKVRTIVAIIVDNYAALVLGFSVRSIHAGWDRTIHSGGRWLPMKVFIDGRARSVHPSITLDRLMMAVEESQVGMSDFGLCIACGEDFLHVEPDARGYECGACGENTVFGAEEILFEVVG